MKRILSLLVCLLLFGVYATFAQDVQIKGTVTSAEDGSTLPGVTVSVKGTTIGVLTDAAGKYTISVPAATESLDFMFMGMKTQSIAIAGQAVIDVVMEYETYNLDEVVVTALGIKREKREVTYQTQKVDDAELLKVAPTRAASALVGKVAGLQINSQDMGVNPTSQITLRGFRSISASNSTLVVIDGSIASVAAFDDLNPNDIQDLNVLKGATAAALYGSKAGNGAIIITTKKGAANQKFTVGLTSSYSIEKVAYMPDFQTEYGTGWEGAYDAIENTNWGPRFDGTMRQIGPTFADGTFQEVPYAPVKNNLLDFFETGNTLNNTLYVSGGDQSSTFYLSAGQQNSNGIVMDDTYKRNTFRANASKRIGKVELAVNSTYFSDKTDVVGDEIGDQDRPLYWFILNTSANIPLSRYKNWQTDLYSSPDGYYNGYYENPYWAIGTTRNEDDTHRLMGNLSAAWDIMPWLKLTTRLGMNNSWGTGKNYRAAQEFDPDLQPSHSAVSSFVEDSEYQRKEYNVDALLSIDHTFNDIISFKANLGATNQTMNYRGSTVRANNLSIPGFYDISNGTGSLEGSVSESEYINYGFFGDFTVGYNNYLYLNFSGRNDWTSTLAKGKNSYFYPALGLSFVITDAFEGIKNNILSFAKITLSNSTVFNDLEPYQINEIYIQEAQDGITAYPYGSINGFRLSRTTVDANISKERLNTTEFGMDLGFLENRITLDAAYYYTVTTDLITSTTPSIASGATAFLTNIGRLESRGLEMSLGGRIIDYSGFNWDLSVNYTNAETTVEEIKDDLKEITVVSPFGTFGIYAVVGEAFPQLKASAYERDPQGRLIIDPASGYPKVQTGFKNMGRTMPKHIVGLNNTFSFKGVSLSATIDYRTGHVYYEEGSDVMEFTGRSLESVSANRQDFVIPNSVIETSPGVFVENTNIQVSNGRQGYWTDVYNTVTENYVKDATALKLREVSLDYTLPAKFLGKTPINKIKIGLIARNLMTWLPKENHFADPEFANSSSNANAVASAYTNPNAVGIGGYLQTPPTRSFGVTLNIEF